MHEIVSNHTILHYSLQLYRFENNNKLIKVSLEIFKYYILDIILCKINRPALSLFLKPKIPPKPNYSYFQPWVSFRKSSLYSANPWLLHLTLSESYLHQRCKTTIAISETYGIRKWEYRTLKEFNINIFR